MRQSMLLGRTLREAPADIELPGLQWAARAGAVRPVGAGLNVLLPLGQRALARLSGLACAAVEALGAQAVTLPALQPLKTPAPETFTVRDRAGRQYALDDGDRALLLRVLQNDLGSYRQLPLIVYNLATLFRDEEKPRGLLRAREFAALSVTSLHADGADLEAFYPRMLEGLSHVLHQCKLEMWSVPVENGHEFLLPHPAGDQVVFTCELCGYRALSDEARFVKLAPPTSYAALPTLHKVATPDCPTIARVAAFLNVPVTQTIKTMMYADEQERVLFVLIRGDLDINAAKLERAAHHTRLSTGRLHPASDAQIQAAGAVPGYASPIGLREAIVIADDSVQGALNMVAGANEPGYHLTGVCLPRDVTPTVVADIAQAREGDACPECRGKLKAIPAIELGGGARLGTALSEAAGVTFLDTGGKPRPPVVGVYGLGLSRILAALLETQYDARGQIGPPAIAPFDVHLIVLGKEPRPQAELLYTQLEQAGRRVLYDDRDESPGVKFTDADLMGLPLRITVSKRHLDKGLVEIKARSGTEARLVAPDNVIAEIGYS